mgnify:CR=1 FL=1
MGVVETYAVERGRLHPEVQAVVVGVGGPDGVEVRVRPVDWLWFRLSGRGSPTPAFVDGGVVYCAEGWLNGERGAPWGNRTGWRALLEEVKHGGQGGSTNRVAWYLGRLADVIRSIPGGKLWDHTRIPMEKEAIAWARESADLITEEVFGRMKELG